MLSTSPRSVLAPLAVVLALVAGTASAQTLSPEARDKMRAVGAACRDDLRALCGDVQPGGGRLARCLVANETKLTPACRAAIEAARPKPAP